MTSLLTGADGLPPLNIGFSYDKAAAHPFSDKEDAMLGYDRHPADTPYTDVVVHSTEHQPGQSFAAVVAYLRDSRDVSIHYAIAGTGRIERVLDPGPWRAWHAGLSLYQGRRNWNDFAVGVELYHRQGDPPYPPAQLLALAALLRTLAHDHPTITQAVCHRWIAVDEYDQYGRKVDPTDWRDADVHAYFARLHLNL